MTNKEIITRYKIANGVDLDDNLLSYAEWQRLGYKVRRGEKSHHKVHLWKKWTKGENDGDFLTKGKNDGTFGTSENDGKNDGTFDYGYKMKLVALFTKEQVERI